MNQREPKQSKNGANGNGKFHIVKPRPLPGETEEERLARLAARKETTLRLFQMVYESHHASENS